MMEALCEIQTGLEAAAGGGDGPAVQGEMDPKADLTATDQKAADTTPGAGEDDLDDADEVSKNAAARKPASESRSPPATPTPQKRPSSPTKEAEAAKSQTPLKRQKAAGPTLIGGPAETAAARHRGTEAGGKTAAATATATLHE